jgi:hypothetical protein
MPAALFLYKEKLRFREERESIQTHKPVRE